MRAGLVGLVPRRIGASGDATKHRVCVQPFPPVAPVSGLPVCEKYSSLVKNAHDMREHVTVQLASDATRLRKPSNELSSRRKLVLSLVFGVVIVGHLVAITTRRERWPFSHYPMFSGLRNKPEVEQNVLVGLTEDGREVQLVVEKHLRPFDQPRMHTALQRISKERGERAYRHAIASVLSRYEALRANGEHDGPKLVGLAGYQHRWRLESGAQNRDRPERKLLFSVGREQSMETSP